MPPVDRIPSAGCDDHVTVVKVTTLSTTMEGSLFLHHTRTRRFPGQRTARFVLENTDRFPVGMWVHLVRSGAFSPSTRVTYHHRAKSRSLSQRSIERGRCPELPHAEPHLTRGCDETGRRRKKLKYKYETAHVFVSYPLSPNSNCCYDRRIVSSFLSPRKFVIAPHVWSPGARASCNTYQQL